MSTEKNLNNLVINKVESQDVYDYMKSNSLINADELYLVEGDDEITIVEATESESGLMSASDKVKLNGIQENAQVNQNAFSNVVVGENILTADEVTDTLTVTAGNNITLTPDEAGNGVAIAAKVINRISQEDYDDKKANNLLNEETLYFIEDASELATSTTVGLMSPEDKVKLDSVAEGAEVNVQSDWNETDVDSDAYIQNKPTTLPADGGNADTVNNHTVKSDVPENAVFTDTVYTHPGYDAQSSGLYKITVDDTGHVSAVSAVVKSDITSLGIPAEDTTYSEAGDALGLVKSGGDVTIENGIITVNDDSHNHVIDNIDGLQAELNSKVDFVDGMGLSSNDYTTEEKNKLANIEPGANNYSLPVATSDILGGIKSGTDITVDSSGNVSVNDDSHNHVISNIDNLQATLDEKVDVVEGKGLSTNDLTDGLKSNYDKAYTHSQQAHAPADAEANVIVGVQQNGTDLTIDSNKKVNVIVPTKISDLTNDSDFATTTDLESKVDKVTGKDLSTNDYTTEEKAKLASIEEGANNTVVDSALSSTSENPVQNKAINAKLTSMQTDIDSRVPSSRTVNSKNLSADITLTASDVGALPDTTVIPSIEGLATEDYVNEKVADLVDSAPETLDTLNELAAALGDDPNFATTVATQIGEKVDKVDGKGLSTNDLTNDLKSNYDTAYAHSQATHAPTDAEANQNAFSNVTIGEKTISADSKTDTLILVGSDNVTLTPDVENDTITISAVDTTYSEATTSTSGLMSSKDKIKIDGIAEGAQVNQNAFSNITVGGITVSADTSTDTLTLVAGDNVTINPDADSDKITISSQDTIYTHPTYTARTGEPSNVQTPGFGERFTLSQVISDTQGHVTDMNTYTVTIPNSTATTSVAGLMSSGDKTKLNNIEDYANNYSLPVATSSDLGGVKSGTDITVDEDGNVSVNDNSHNHTMSNVTGLEAALDEKVDKVNGKGLSTEDYTTAEQTKLASIADGAEVNQNAFSNIVVGSITVSADSATDTLTVEAGDNITLVPDIDSDKITISAVDTTYSTGTSTISGLTKLYSETGANTDGTMTQYSITSALSDKVDTANGQYAVTTEGDGAAYTATVPGITTLTTGVSFIMIPHVVSTSTSPTLNVNGLGAKNIKRRLTSIATSLQSGYTASWLGAGLPFRVVYDGTQWITEGHDKPAGADLYGAATTAKADEEGNNIIDTYATKVELEDYLPKTTITFQSSSDEVPTSLTDGTILFIYEE